MNTRQKTNVLITLAVAAGAGLLWWLFPSGSPQAGPVAATPLAPVGPVNSSIAPVEATHGPAAPMVVPGQPIPISAPEIAQTPSQVVGASLVQPVATSPSAAPASVVEVAATERMYLAHASLREPEVADPDSAANRRILQTMVTKALMHSGGEPAARP